MKVLLLIINIIITISLFSGCAVNKTALKPPSKPKAFAYKTDGKYYYFIEAQLQRKMGNLSAAEKYLKEAIKLDQQSLYLKKELTFIYLQLQKQQLALDLADEMIRQHPDNVDAQIIYGRVNHGLGNIDNAKKAYNKIIDLDPKKKEIYLLLGSLYMEDEELTKAHEVYEKLVDNFPKSYAGHFFLGKIYAKKELLNKARKEFKKTIELAPDLEEPRFELIRLYEKTNDKKKIIDLYREILKKDPDSIRAALQLGYYYHKNGMKKDAEKLFIKLGKRSISDKAVLRTAAELFLEEERYDAARVVFEGMLKGAPNSSALNYAEGIISDNLRDYKRALTYYKKVKPDSVFYQNAAVNISFVYQKLGKIDLAINKLVEVAKESPDNPNLLFYLGSFYEDANEFAKAEKALIQGLEIDRDNTSIYFRLGVVYDKWGKKDECIDAMKKVISLEPDHADALNYLGYTYADLGENLDDAEKLIKKALEHRPGDGYITDSLGWVYYKKGLYQNALKYLKEAAKLVPDDPIILEHLGDAYYKTDNWKKAVEAYKNSLLKKKNDKEDLKKKILKLTGGDE